MTNQELQDRLKSFPPDTEVIMDSGEWGLSDDFPQVYFGQVKQAGCGLVLGKEYIVLSSTANGTAYGELVGEKGPGEENG